MDRLLRLFRKTAGKFKTDINKFIRKAALNNEPIFVVYKKLWINYGTMDYADFEWRYYQFYHGSRDLTIEKSPSNSSPLTFSDLPMDVVEKIVIEMKLVDRLLFRKVSRNLRRLVDSTESHCKKVEVSTGIPGFSATFDNFRLFNWTALSGTFSDNGATFLKNPKLKIDQLHFSMSDLPTQFVDFMKNLNVQLDVRRMEMVVHTYPKLALPVLQLLKPGNLDEMRLCVLSRSFEHPKEDLMETEQWKKTRKLHSNLHITVFPAEHFLHFEEIHLTLFHFSDENLILVRDILLKSKTSRIESCCLKDSRLSSAYFNFVKDTVDRIMAQDPAYDPKTCRFSIPNSPAYFQLEHVNEGFYGLRIKKQSGN